jgi:hypothetical protein
MVLALQERRSQESHALATDPKNPDRTVGSTLHQRALIAEVSVGDPGETLFLSTVT